MRRALLRHSVPDVAEKRELARAADERAGDVVVLACNRAHRQPRADGLGLPFRDDRLCRHVLDRAVRRVVRDFAHDDAVDRRGLLQAGGRVDDVARHHRLTERRARAERDERLARVDGDPHALDAVAYRKRSADGALGIVAERGRSAEHGHHRVADELLHDAAERFELFADGVVVRREQCTDVFRVEALGLAGEPDEIDEDDADDAAFLLRPRGGVVERRSAGGAESGSLRALVAADGACGHARRVRRR